MTRFSALNIVVAALWRLEPARVVISGDDIVPLTIEPHRTWLVSSGTTCSLFSATPTAMTYGATSQ